jgi:exopolysaccharide production protein ExoZ
VERLRSIQALRAIAVVAVVCSHAFATPHGSSGVDLFFVISGFIIARVSRDRSALVFAKARFHRIYPLYLLAASPYLLWHLAQTELDGPRITATLTLWPIWAGEYQKPFLPPAWSLYFEVLFYAAVALWLVSKRLAVTGAAMLVLLALLRPSALTDFLFSPIILEFAAGYGLAKLRNFRLAVPALLLGLSLLFSPAREFPAHTMLDASEAALRAVMFGIPAVLIVYGALGTEKLFATRWAKPLVRIGDASYSIYLTHLVAVLGMGEMSPIAKVIAALLLGLVVHIFVEKPLASWPGRSRKQQLRSNALPA